MRRTYGLGELLEDHVDPDAVAQVRRWLDDAVGFGIAEPNAMVIATADSDGRPSARTVLLKHLDERGFVFYTNQQSRKGDEIAANPRCALVFPWHAMERQVRVEGRAAGGGVQLRIIDHGPGLPAADRDRIFAPFQRLNDTSDTGLGLGLAIARGFTEAMSGRLTPSDTPGGGLTMTVDLPVAA